MNIWLILATVAAFATFNVHTFVGTRFAVPPLVAAESQLPKAAIWLNYLCWHIVTAMLLVLTFALGVVTMSWLSRDVALVAGLLFITVSLVSLIATSKGGIPFYRFPASYLGAISAALSLAGYAL
jgi:ABC-type multidrug transport system fused ATPase/permease subunit